MKKLIVAGSAGFCFGVRRSVEMAEKLLSEYGSCASLGALIHNEDVIHDLQRRGMRVVHDPAELSPGERVLVHVEIPANTRADVELPGMPPVSVGSGSYDWLVSRAMSS